MQDLKKCFLLPLQQGMAYLFVFLDARIVGSPPSCFISRMMSVFTETLVDFKKRVESLLCGPEPDSPPVVPPVLFPPEQPPDLLVFASDRNEAKLRAVRAQLPGRSVLFYLCLTDATPAAAQWTTAMQGRTLACCLDPKNSCCEKLAFLLMRLPRRRVRLIIDPEISERLGDWPRLLKETIRFTLDKCEQERNRGLIRLRCSILNLASIIANSRLKLLPVPPGTDAIVCGAGPSLELQLDLLRAAQGRALLMAAGHAAPFLVRSGIKPDVVIEMDSYADINWPDDLRIDCLLAAATEAAPGVARRFKHVLWFAATSPAFAAGLKVFGLRLPEIAVSRTVTASALDLAIRFGCRRVALVGQDLCLGEKDRLHAGASGIPEHEAVFETLGNDGAAVRTTHELNDLRDGIQAFLRAVNRAFAGKTPAPLIVNCTRGGAKIEGIARLDFERFVMDLPGAAPLGNLFDVAVAAPDVSEDLVGLTRNLQQAIDLAAETANAAIRLENKLTVAASQENALRELRYFRSALADEFAFSAEQSLAIWMQPALSFAAEISEEIAVQRGLQGLLFEIERNKQRSWLLQDLYKDLIEDLNASMITDGRGQQGLPAAMLRNPNAFIGFRRLAIRCVGDENPKLAEWMGQQEFPTKLPNDRFEARWRNQMAPFARIRSSNDNWIAMTSLSGVAEQARRDVAQWLMRSKFDPAHHAVIFVAPGTWLHVLELVRRFPKISMAVLEPWPQWLLALCDHGCLAHALPPRALVVAADNCLPDWRKLFKTRMSQWEKAGLQKRLFPHPRIAALPEIAALLDELTPMTR